MSIRYGSERIDQLPLSSDALQPTDYARIAPLLEEGYTVSKSLPHYSVAFILFVVLSFGFVDKLITGYAPSLAQVPIALLLAKALVFVVVLYMADYFLTRNKK